MVISKEYVPKSHSCCSMWSLSSSKENILIVNGICACLADFSLLTMVSDQFAVTSSWTECGSVPWMSPELIDPERFGLEESRPTKASDCYALGMVLYEVLSGKRPFSPNPLPVVIQMIVEGKHPRRPQGHSGELFTDSIWEVMEHCWEVRPDNRMDAKAVLLGLEEGQPPLRSTSNPNRDVEMVGEVGVPPRQEPAPAPYEV